MLSVETERKLRRVQQEHAVPVAAAPACCSPHGTVRRAGSSARACSSSTYWPPTHPPDAAHDAEVNEPHPPVWQHQQVAGVHVCGAAVRGRGEGPGSGQGREGPGEGGSFPRSPREGETPTGPLNRSPMGQLAQPSAVASRLQTRPYATATRQPQVKRHKIHANPTRVEGLAAHHGAKPGVERVDQHQLWLHCREAGGRRVYGWVGAWSRERGSAKCCGQVAAWWAAHRPQPLPSCCPSRMQHGQQVQASCR